MPGIARSIPIVEWQLGMLFKYEIAVANVIIQLNPGVGGAKY